MSAAQAAGTPAAAPAAPTAAEAPTAAANGIDAVLGDLSDIPAEADDNGDAALDALTAGDTPEAEATEPEAQPADRAARLDDEVIFSDQALETKEGVLKAKGRIRDLQKLQHQKYIELKGFEKKVIKRHENLKRGIDKFVADKRSTDLLARNMTHINAEMRSGDPDRMVAALGAWTGQDGLKAAEQFISTLTHRGQPKVEPHVQAVLDAQKREIDQLKSGLTERAEAERTQQLEGSLSRHGQQIQQLALSSTSTPHVTRFMQDDPQGTTDFIINEITEAHAAGKPFDIRSYFGNLEARLAPHFEAGRAPQGDGGGSVPKQPSQVQRSPGQSVGPSRAASSNPRTPTEEESLRALADDTAFMNSLGF